MIKEISKTIALAVFIPAIAVFTLLVVIPSMGVNFFYNRFYWQWLENIDKTLDAASPVGLKMHLILVVIFLTFWIFSTGISFLIERKLGDKTFQLFAFFIAATSALGTLVTIIIAASKKTSSLFFFILSVIVGMILFGFTVKFFIKRDDT